MPGGLGSRLLGLNRIFGVEMDPWLGVPWKDGGALLPPWEKRFCLLPWRGLALFACWIGNKDRSGGFLI